jgi:hypothetical protein
MWTDYTQAFEINSKFITCRWLGCKDNQAIDIPSHLISEKIKSHNQNRITKFEISSHKIIHDVVYTIN